MFASIPPPRSAVDAQPPDFVSACDASLRSGGDAGVLLLRADRAPYRGAHVQVHGAPRLNFGSCSYLALEVHEQLRQGVIDAVTAYGTQFPFAKPQLECPLYGELQALLEQMTGGRVVIASSATLAHLAALPAIVGRGDAVVIDRLAHASLHQAMRHVDGVPIEVLPHDRMDVLEARVSALEQMHERVWYVLDGVYSMSGSRSPIAELEAMLGRHPQLWLYADDAHCTSWLGRHGRGWTLDRLADRTRVVVTLSLNKAFSAGGAALVLPTEALRARVVHAGAPMMFSGPLQPPQLGAAVASARLHLTPELDRRQALLADRIAHAHALARQHGIRLASTDPTPIMFVACGPEDGMYALFHAMLERGYYLAPAVFPAVARGKAGLRLTASLHNSADELERMFLALADEIGAIASVAAHQQLA
jgi:7-keto-8-aminopelargonate synthetase-like enzyme